MSKTMPLTNIANGIKPSISSNILLPAEVNTPQTPKAVSNIPNTKISIDTVFKFFNLLREIFIVQHPFDQAYDALKIHPHLSSVLILQTYAYCAPA